jgi:hypothetical protein
MMGIMVNYSGTRMSVRHAPYVNKCGNCPRTIFMANCIVLAAYMLLLCPILPSVYLVLYISYQFSRIQPLEFKVAASQSPVMTS